MMSPENYRFIERKSRDVIQRVNLYIEGETAERLIVPMVLMDEINNLSNEISEAIGVCNMAAKNSKTVSIKGKYQALLHDLRESRQKLAEM